MDLAQRLQRSTQVALHGGVQHTDDMTASVLKEFAAKSVPASDATAKRVRAAMVRSMFGATPYFAGAPALLAEAHRLGYATVLVTDTTWHSDKDLWERIREMGLVPGIDHVVSSFELGVRKPDPEVFQTALARAGAAASDSIMAGDSEANDIEPAAALGMATVRVTVQFPLAGSTIADAVVTNLDELREIVVSWSG